MTDVKADIYPYEVRSLVYKLIKFLGRQNIEQKIRQYNENLKSSGPVYQEYYLKRRHPWWEALQTFYELERQGRSIEKNLTEGLGLLAGDARKITVLQGAMPVSVRDNYKRNLLDDENANAYLFEVNTAWHYHLEGHNITWYEADGKRHAEFSVKTEDFEFDVECKRISVDSFRKIKRPEFYRFVELLLPEIHKMDLRGKLSLILDKPLKGNMLVSLKERIIEIINNGHVGKRDFDFGTIEWDLEMGTNCEIDMQKMSEEILRTKPYNAHSAIFTKGRPVDPIGITCMYKEADNILEGMRIKLSDACKQLDNARPGIIVCFIEEIDDFSALRSKSGLQTITNNFLGSIGKEHVAAVIYNSNSKYIKKPGSRKYYSDALIFRNLECKFPAAAQYNYVSKPL